MIQRGDVVLARFPFTDPAQYAMIRCASGGQTF